MGFSCENRKAYPQRHRLLTLPCSLRTSAARVRLALIIILALPSVLGFPIIADAATRKTLTPRVSLQEQYDDNIYLEADNEDSDWITLVSPGISLALEGPDTTMNLDYEAGFSFYQDDTDMNSTRHQAQGDWNQRLTPSVMLQASDAFVRSEEPLVETAGQIKEIRTERSIYYRNDGQASVSCDFGAEDQVTAGYRNRYLNDGSSLDEDSQGHEGFLGLDKWFSSHYGIGMTFSYNRGHFEQTHDFDAYQGGLTLNYRPRLSRRLYGRYNLLYHDFEPAEADDYRIHHGALGLVLTLGYDTDLNLEGGYFVQDYLNGDQTEGGTFNGGLSTRIKSVSLNLGGSSGYDEDYFSSENLGFYKFRRVSGSVKYLITDSFYAFGTASYSWQEFFGTDTHRDRKDEVWHTSAGLSLSFWQWLTLSLEGTNSKRDSDDPGMDFEDNRGLLRLTVSYPHSF